MIAFRWTRMNTIGNASNQHHSDVSLGVRAYRGESDRASLGVAGGRWDALGCDRNKALSSPQRAIVST
jgi:hypothetical protein